MGSAQGTVMPVMGVIMLVVMIVMMIVMAPMIMVMAMVMMVVGMGVGRLPRHRRLPASAYATHHSTSRSLIRNSSPAVTCT